MQGRAEGMAKFLLNPYLCPLRLYIQIQGDQDSRSERHDDAGRKRGDANESFHAETLRSPSLKKRSKPIPDCYSLE